MRGNRRRDTSPERELRSALHRRGWRFRTDCRIRAGSRTTRPDIAFTRWKLAVFVDGCFWHGCPEHGVAPKSNTTYWSAKLARNVQRDREDTEGLEGAGWTVLRVWEHLDMREALEAVERELVARGAKKARKNVK
jgi:DNA mismatch endonuclease (patch repair protein)